MTATSLAGQIHHWRRELKDEGDTVSDFEHCVMNEIQKFFTGDGDPKAIANAISAAFCRNPDYADPSQMDAPEQIDDSRQPWQAWSDFVWIIVNTAFFSDDAGLHTGLAQLVVEMMLQPDATNETGHAIVSIDSTEEFPEEHMYIMNPGEAIFDPFGKRYFRDLPEFLMEVGRFFQGPLSFADRETGEVTEDGWNEWARINAFTAHLAVAGRQAPGSALGAKSERFGSTTMTFTLRCPDLDDFSDIRAVAHWLAIDGHAMYQNATWGNWKAEEIARPEFLGRHRRWQVWKEELQRVAKDGAASERNVAAAKEALQTMDRIERDAS